MLDQARLSRVTLARRPLGQRLVANFALALDYRFPRAPQIVFEGTEHIPLNGGAFLAMNHTDRYNYWPFQYRAYRLGLPFTATWVKGKYYENKWMGRFMDSMNNIPMPSRGYMITTEFRNAVGRPPSEIEYRALRDLVDGDGALASSSSSFPASADLDRFLGPDRTVFRARFEALFDEMMRAVCELNRRAIEDLGLNVLVFPEGTRSRRLSRGHDGLAQIAQHLGAPIVPIGCSGSDTLYPGNSPLSKGGKVTYRIGAPIDLDAPEVAAYRVPRGPLPFTTDATRCHGASYSALTEVVMNRINDLIDPEYRRENTDELGARGAERFV